MDSDAGVSKSFERAIPIKFIKKNSATPQYYFEILALAEQGIFVDRALANSIATNHVGIKPHSVLVASARLRAELPNFFLNPEEFGRTGRITSGAQNDESEFGKSFYEKNYPAIRSSSKDISSRLNKLREIVRPITKLQHGKPTFLPYYEEVLALAMGGVFVNKELAEEIAARHRVQPSLVLTASTRLAKMFPIIFLKSPEFKKKEEPLFKKPFPAHYLEILALAENGIFVDKALAHSISAKHPNIKPHAVLAASSRLRKLLPNFFPKPKELGRVQRLASGWKIEESKAGTKFYEANYANVQNSANMIAQRLKKLKAPEKLAPGARRHESTLPAHYREVLELARRGVFVDHALAVEIAGRYKGIKPHAIKQASSRLRRMFPKDFPKQVLRKDGARLILAGRRNFTQNPLYSGIVELLKKKQYLDKMRVNALAEKYSTSDRFVWKMYYRIRDVHPELFPDLKKLGRKRIDPIVQHRDAIRRHILQQKNTSQKRLNLNKLTRDMNIGLSNSTVTKEAIRVMQELAREGHDLSGLRNGAGRAIVQKIPKGKARRR